METRDQAITAKIAKNAMNHTTQWGPSKDSQLVPSKMIQKRTPNKAHHHAF